ncbi:YceI family protein [Fluviispira sanaruensis]|uniref:YceI family protein n=1 Tax=Fluviispira sanaruensis TaxID=2493639 RepID=A0A4P2VN53_FLUSA|nr:YceI family protein [Fluviispira sanaruensis]BBH53524.1 YceI family protein [Fluviispira sanaruensis]
MLSKKIAALYLASISVTLQAFSNEIIPKHPESIIVAEAATKADAPKYVVDTDHSKVTFEVAHLVVSTVTGEFKKFSGNFKFNPEDFSQTQLEASAISTSVDTGVKKRDDHLKSADFFDAKKFPNMIFKSTSAKKTDDNKFDLIGNITIRGVTKPITFKVTYKGQVKSSGKITQAFKATAELVRKDFGVSFQNIVEAGPVVGDVVTINIICEGVRKI